MRLSLGGPGVACSALRARRLLAGELAGAERARAEEHLADCARCQATRREVDEEREALARAMPFEDFAAGVAEKMAGREPRRWLRGLPLALAAGMAVAVALPFALRRGGEREDGTRLKGAAALQLYVQEGSRSRQLAPGEPVPPGARLRAAVSPAGRRFAGLALVDADGAAILYTGPATAGPLPEAFEWTGASADGTLVLVLADEPLDAAALEARLARAEPAAGPGERSQVVRLPIRRGPAR